MRKEKEAMEHSEKQVCKNCISVRAGLHSVRVRDTSQWPEPEASAKKAGRDVAVKSDC